LKGLVHRQRFFTRGRTELESVRLKPNTIESIIRNEFADRAAGELERVKKIGGDILILDDGSYPSLLREIADPPITLYVRGEWQTCLEQPCVGVIGSRMCSTYGENAAEMLSRDLASRGVNRRLGLCSRYRRGRSSRSHPG
jgi:DNA processing protein